MQVPAFNAAGAGGDGLTKRMTGEICKTGYILYMHTAHDLCFFSFILVRLIIFQRPMSNARLIVAGPAPLISLAAADELDTLLMLMPAISILVPDMVRHELIQRIDQPGAVDALEWIRANESGQVFVRATEEFEEYAVLRTRAMKPDNNRCELAAWEVIGRELQRDAEAATVEPAGCATTAGALIVLCDDTPALPALLARLPESVLVFSTSGYLEKLRSRQVKPMVDALLQRLMNLGRSHRA
ncbi:hypothetical protein SAMN06265795_1229 [Noviherbaspirillum humi]|uniref:Uncharacterized protein n=1 Tax=Noviherbaspirillum humi TaxID=1688639 RepID=A0A239LDW0_9BURK|nr:hypothetical protein [Noviherbaspirillum humi]SNT28500.1 hypothetical protein SAMN06265795_1229 [Noviherbaspirillum humi]